MIGRLRVALAFSPRAWFRRPGAGPALVFVHIPKTAGATVESMLIGAYSKSTVRGSGNYFRHPEPTRRAVTRARWTGTWIGAPVVVGHVPYALFAMNLPGDTPYMTFLREPVDRVLSHYHRHIERKSRVSLEEALERRLPEVHNLATRLLCDDPSPLGELHPNALDEARANLRGFAFVGIQERFEESVVLLQRMLGLDLVPYLNRHVSTDRPEVEGIVPRQRALIEEHNRLDVELYAFALERFEETVAAADERLAADVERLRTLSREANEEALRKASDWFERELPVGATRPTATLYADAEAAGVPESALKHVIARSAVEKVKDRDGAKAFRRSSDAR
jgi:hypothetical protein